jgi:hypothetical protein
MFGSTSRPISDHRGGPGFLNCSWRNSIDGVSAVHFGGASAVGRVIGETQLSVRVPSGTGTVDASCHCSRRHERSSPADRFTYTT